MPLDIIQTNTALPFFLFVFIFSSHFHGVTSHCAHKHNQYLVEHLWIHDRDEGDAFLHPCRWRCVCVLVILWIMASYILGWHRATDISDRQKRFFALQYNQKLRV